LFVVESILCLATQIAKTLEVSNFRYSKDKYVELFRWMLKCADLCLKCIYRSYVRSRTSYELITRIEGELGYRDTLPLVKELYPCA